MNIYHLLLPQRQVKASYKLWSASLLAFIGTLQYGRQLFENKIHFTITKPNWISVIITQCTVGKLLASLKKLFTIDSIWFDRWTPCDMFLMIFMANYYIPLTTKGYIGFTLSICLSVCPACHVCSVAWCLFHGLYPCVAQKQPMNGWCVTFRFQVNRSKVKVTQVIWNFEVGAGGIIVNHRSAILSCIWSCWQHLVMNWHR